jgi:N-acetyl-anhydromuramyl-L-alanine amidase AmpD
MAKKRDDPGELRGWRNGATRSEFDSWSEERKKEFFSFLYEPMPTDEQMMNMLEQLGCRRDDGGEQS